MTIEFVLKNDSDESLADLYNALTAAMTTTRPSGAPATG
jgi:hypothetical protein